MVTVKEEEGGCRKVVEQSQCMGRRRRREEKQRSVGDGRADLLPHVVVHVVYLREGGAV